MYTSKMKSVPSHQE